MRFFLLSRKPDTEYTFDVDLAVAKNNDNPVYYVQYAHARICSVLASWGGARASLSDVDLSALSSPQAQALMLLLAKYPEMLLVANVPVQSRPMDILDEHYYSSPEFFMRCSTCSTAARSAPSSVTA